MNSKRRAPHALSSATSTTELKPAGVQTLSPELYERLRQALQELARDPRD